jgi:hypothetical protein
MLKIAPLFFCSFSCAWSGPLTRNLSEPQGTQYYSFIKNPNQPIRSRSNVINYYMPSSQLPIQILDGDTVLKHFDCLVASQIGEQLTTDVYEELIAQ